MSVTPVYFPQHVSLQPWAGQATVNDWAAFVCQLQLDTTACLADARQWLVLWQREGLQPHQAYQRTLHCLAAGMDPARVDQDIRAWRESVLLAGRTQQLHLIRSHRKPASFGRQLATAVLPFLVTVAFAGLCLVVLVTSL